MNVAYTVGSVIYVFMLMASAWMAYDSIKNRITINARPYTAANSGPAWMLISLLWFFWFIVFPYYLIIRARKMRAIRGALTQCLECGAPVIAGNNYCSHCGKPVRMSLTTPDGPITPVKIIGTGLMWCCARG